MIAVLLTVIVVLIMALVWRWRLASPGASPVENGSSLFLQLSPVEKNFLRQKYPDVNFARFYPGLDDSEIDAIQRETYSVRLGYYPFLQFAPLAVDMEHVKVSPQGFRRGVGPSPWPPPKEELSVFVFGGSTVFGYGLPDRQTLVSALEIEMSAAFPNRRVRCYNFGRGFYYSTQERLLLETLLLAGTVPDAVLYIDGLNDFLRYDGRPFITPSLHAYLAADLPYPNLPPVGTAAEQMAVAAAVLTRYENNLNMIRALADRFGFKTAFVGQPVPHFHYPRNPELFPFGGDESEDPVVRMGYPEFERRGRAGAYGHDFIWLGDVFESATEPMYLDQAHYTAKASQILAEKIVVAVQEGQLFDD